LRKAAREIVALITAERFFLSSRSQLTGWCIKNENFEQKANEKTKKLKLKPTEN